MSPYEHSRRAVYRVMYPERERPTFNLEGERFAVVDCSELGLRYVRPPGHSPEVGTTVHGHVLFRRGSEVGVSGEVIRVEPATVAIWFRIRPIPLAEMLAERAYLAAAGEEST